jgi:hypothetical protein
MRTFGFIGGRGGAVVAFMVETLHRAVPRRHPTNRGWLTPRVTAVTVSMPRVPDGPLR